MASRHYGNQVFVVHAWGTRNWQHTWEVYGSAKSARIQAARMSDFWGEGTKVETFPVQGSGEQSPHA